MPTYDEITALASTPLTDAEVNYVRRILRKGATVAVPTAAEVAAAVALLEPEQCQEVRALFDTYGQHDLAGEVTLDGGADALKFDAVQERWAVRNDLRVLLGFTAEPRIVGNDSLVQVLIELPTITLESEEA